MVLNIETAGIKERKMFNLRYGLMSSNLSDKPICITKQAKSTMGNIIYNLAKRLLVLLYKKIFEEMVSFIFLELIL